jgi:hypothetical protein
MEASSSYWGRPPNLKPDHERDCKLAGFQFHLFVVSAPDSS